MRTVFTGGRVFDPRALTFGDADVAIEHDRVVAVGSGVDGDVAVDAAGKTIVPGFIDCHIHAIVSDLDVWRLAQTPLSFRFYDAARNLAITLAAGVTTARDAAGADLGVKLAVERSLIPGPRLQIAIGMISQTGGHTECWTSSGLSLHAFFPTYPGRPSTTVDGPEAVRRTVRELVRAGADVIKVAASGGLIAGGDAIHRAHFSADELAALTAEAEAAGRAVMAHANAAAGIRAALRAGVRSIEHGVFLDDECIDLLLKRNTFLVPTLGITDAVEAGARARGDDEHAARAAEIREAHHESFRRALAAGVPIAMGTDSGITPHGDNLLELGRMAKLGMPPERCLAAATATAADLLGLSDSIGTLEPGKLADFVVVDGDPLELETLTRRIVHVYKGGRRCGEPAEPPALA